MDRIRGAFAALRRTRSPAMMYYKPLIFAVSLVWGGGMFGYAMNVQEEQRALEQLSLQPSPDAVNVIPPPRVPRISEPAPVVVEPAALEIEPVVIEAVRHRAKPRVPKAV